MTARHTRNADATRSRILEAATLEFAEKGFDGARVDQIAARAAVNKQMIYHYFGNKDALFTRTLAEAYASIREQEAALNLDHLPADEAVLALVDFTWNYYLAHPEFIKLLNTENQMSARHTSSAIVDINASYRAVTQRLLERGRREGTIREDIDVTQLNISIAALGFFYLINRHTLSQILCVNLMAPEALRTRLEVMREIIGRWIRPA